MKKIVLTGGTGFVGQHLLRFLQESCLDRYKVIVLTRHKNLSFQKDFPHVELVEADVTNGELPKGLFNDVYAIIHLAGSPISVRWNKKVKTMIYDSRVKSTKNLYDAVVRDGGQVRVFIHASAIGYYGDGGEKVLSEEAPNGDDFLAKVCHDWEVAGASFKAIGARHVAIRTGLVLGEEGLLAKLLPIFRWGLGGKLGTGKQWMSWIHIDDLVRIYIEALEDSQLQGSVNSCSPKPVRNFEFTITLARLLKRPAFLPVPVFLLRLLYGELALALVMSQRVMPQKLMDKNFVFQKEQLAEALSSLSL